MKDEAGDEETGQVKDAESRDGHDGVTYGEPKKTIVERTVVFLCILRT